jgi:hypothetical protein
MALPEPWLTLLHPTFHTGATLGWAGAAVWLLARPRAIAPRRLQELCAALLAGGALPLAGWGGWWVDMTGAKMLVPVGALAVTLAVAGCRALAGRLATLALAGFFVTMGIVTLHHGGPLPPFAAAKAMLLGGALLLLPWSGAVRLRSLAVLPLLAAAACLGAMGEIPSGP